MHHTEFGITGKTNFHSCAMEIGDPIDFVVSSSCAIAKVCGYVSGAKVAHPGGTGKKLVSFLF